MTDKELIDQLRHEKQELYVITHEAHKAHQMLRDLLDPAMPNNLSGAVEYMIGHSSAGWLRVVELMKEIKQLQERLESKDRQIDELRRERRHYITRRVEWQTECDRLQKQLDTTNSRLQLLKDAITKADTAFQNEAPLEVKEILT